MKYSRIIILSIVTLFLWIGSAFATEIQVNTGYSVTYDKAGSWSVNWTSEAGSKYFFGSIVAGGISVEWENSEITVNNSPTLNFMDYSAGSGFGFTTSDDENILFNLGSSEDFDIYLDLGEGKVQSEVIIDENYAFTGVIDDQVVTGAGVMKSFEIAPAPVPEPATMFLLGSGLFGLAGFSRKRFSKKG
ncbi:MAG: PEP-CTERM sorting domain-containing protein [Desulfobacteraceae bacterium]